MFSATAADINKGYSFAPAEQNVTHTKLNNLVDLATINSSFITDKAVATPAASDSFLFYSASALGMRRAPYSSIFLGNTNLIFSQNELNTPQTNDYLLLQSAAGLLFKSSLNALFLTNDFLINARTNWVTPSMTTTYFLAYDQGAWSKVSRSNLFYQPWGVLTFTNLLTRTTPANNDALLLWDTTDGTNTQTTLAGLVTNTATATVATNGDFFWGYSTNQSRIAKFTPLQVAHFTVQKSVFANIPLPGADAVYTNAHGLAGLPQIVRPVLVCTNAELGYSAGDEVDISGVAMTGGGPVTCASADATNVFMNYNAGGINVQVCNKSTGSAFNITKSKWNFKIYTTYFP